MSFRSKLFMLLLLVALVPGLVAIGLDFTTTRQLNKSILERSRENTLEDVERGLHLVIDGLLKTIDMSATMLESELANHANSLRESLSDGEDLTQAARRILLKNRLVSTHIRWEGVYLPADQAILVRMRQNGEGSSRATTLHVVPSEGMPWIFDVQQCASPCWKGNIPDPTSGDPTAIVSMAVAGVSKSPSAQSPAVVMAYDFSPLFSMFRDGILPGGTEAFLVQTGNGNASTDFRELPVQAFASPYQSVPEFLHSSNSTGFRRMVDDLIRNKRGVMRMEHRGRLCFWAYATFPNRPLAFVLISPMSPYLETVMRTQSTIDSIFQEQIRFMEYMLLAMAMLLIFLSSVFSRRITQPLADLAGAMTRIAKGDYTARVEEKNAGDGAGKDEIEVMRRTFNVMAANIEEHEQTKEDLSAARLIQRRLLPETSPILHGWDIAGECLYSQETGGDIYDFILTPPHKDGRERITLSVGDATGHGTQAALLMTTARAMLRALLYQGKPLATAISELNWLLTRDTYGTGRFLSLFAVEIVASSPVLRWVRCGHEPALLYFSDRDAVTHLRGPGAILGVDSSLRFEAEQISLRPGSVLLLATDGVWETTSPNGEMYGHTRLEMMIRTHANQSAGQIVAAIMEDLRLFREKDAPEDDSTVIVAKYQA